MIGGIGPNEDNRYDFGAFLKAQKNEIIATPKLNFDSFSSYILENLHDSSYKPISLPVKKLLLDFSHKQDGEEVRKYIEVTRLEEISKDFPELESIIKNLVKEGAIRIGYLQERSREESGTKAIRANEVQSPDNIVLKEGAFIFPTFDFSQKYIEEKQKLSLNKSLAVTNELNFTAEDLRNSVIQILKKTESSNEIEFEKKNDEFEVKEIKSIKYQDLLDKVYTALTGLNSESMNNPLRAQIANMIVDLELEENSPIQSAETEKGSYYFLKSSLQEN